MENNNLKRIGLFFGSFNPVHIGHMAIANYFYSFSPLDEIWFVVSPQNPLKQNEALVSFIERLKMVQLAVDNFTGFFVSDVESHLSKPSYTVNTIEHLQKEFPLHEFTLIIGEDNFASFTLWKDYNKILSKYSIYVYNRSGKTNSALKFYSNITFHKAPLLDISSTFIRDAMKKDKNIRFFLPEKVFDYIEKHNLYRP